MEDKCIGCNQPTEESFTANDWNGMCHSSGEKPLCKDCRHKATKLTEHGVFLLIKAGLVYYNPYPFGGFSRIRTKGQLDNIFNKDYNTVLSYI